MVRVPSLRRATGAPTHPPRPPPPPNAVCRQDLRARVGAQEADRAEGRARHGSSDAQALCWRPRFPARLTPPPACPSSSLRAPLAPAAASPPPPPQRAAAKATASVANKANRRAIFKRAEAYAREYTARERSLVGMRRRARAQGSFFVEPEQKLLVRCFPRPAIGGPGVLGAHGAAEAAPRGGAGLFAPPSWGRRRLRAAPAAILRLRGGWGWTDQPPMGGGAALVRVGPV